MKTYDVNCRWCGAPGKLSGDEAYEAAGFDPKPLLQCWCCPVCAKRAVERERLQSAIRGICINLSGRPGRALPTMIARYGRELRELLEEYWTMIGRHLNRPLPDWPEDFMEKILASPREGPTVLSRMWSIAKQSQSQAKLL